MDVIYNEENNMSIGNDNLLNKLVESKIDIDDLLLDPNNPRFSTLKKKVNNSKIQEEYTQRNTLENIKNYDIHKLKESILRVGFLSIDRVIVVKLSDDIPKFVVVEGNRRIAAVKSILDDIKVGLKVDKDILKSLREINTLILKNMDYSNSADYQLLIQGLRHISGVKGWKPYQQSRALVTLVDKLGYSITDAAATLGLGRTTASWMRSAYYAYQNMKREKDIVIVKEEIDIIPYFSYFVEVLKSPNLRGYFLWNNKQNKFKNRIEILKFYKWIGITSKDSEIRQIPTALDIRRLYEVLDNQEAKEILESGESIYNALSAISGVESKSENYTHVLQEIYRMIKALPKSFIKHMSIEDRIILGNILDVIENYLR